MVANHVEDSGRQRRVYSHHRRVCMASSFVRISGGLLSMFNFSLHTHTQCTDVSTPDVALCGRGRAFVGPRGLIRPKRQPHAAPLYVECACCRQRIDMHVFIVRDQMKQEYTARPHFSFATRLNISRIDGRRNSFWTVDETFSQAEETMQWRTSQTRWFVWVHLSV